jgi:Phytanoyl-CoA dioxygenase (PhyH)
MTHSISKLLSSLQANGYVIIPSALTPEQLKSLREAAAHATELSRAGKWPFIRTLPKAFPPWPADASNGIWGVQHLLHPDMPGREQFLKAYFGEQTMGPARELLESNDDELVMELFNLLVRPDNDFELRWHRDDVPPTATAKEELEALGVTNGTTHDRAWHAQWNMALYHDTSLCVVPGSHLRARTQTERDADPMASTLPNMLTVELQPGDVVFYNNNILHRGVYDSSKDRLTLHGSVGRAGGARERARNVLQHGIGSWVERCELTGLDGADKDRAEGMKKRLLEMGGLTEDVGYSQPDE